MSASRTPSVQGSAAPLIELELGRPPRAVAVSQALREAARRARSPVATWIPVRRKQGRWQYAFGIGVILGFLVVVVLPSFFSGVYLALIASDQYASETRFAVRGGDHVMLEGIGALIGISATPRFQDSLIVTDYLHSWAAVQDIDASLDLRKIYARPNVDYLSRFNQSRPNEDLLRYWKRHVDVSIDSLSGVITVVVRAFTPRDALDIANKIIVFSEKLVNDLSERSRRDALRQAEAELSRAEANLQDKIKAMRDLRNNERVLDADKTAEAMTKMLAELRLQRLKLEQEYTVQRRSVSEQSPQLKVLEARIASIKDQAAQLEAQMTSRGASQVLSDAISRFDRERLDHDLAQKQYVAASAAFQRARLDLESQQVYLTTFLRPVLAEDALYPKRWWLWSIITVICLALWGGGVGGAVLVRNHVAI